MESTLDVTYLNSMSIETAILAALHAGNRCSYVTSLLLNNTENSQAQTLSEAEVQDSKYVSDPTKKQPFSECCLKAN